MPINRNNMDVVICVAKKDCLIVRKTIKYIRSCFCVEHIYLLIAKEYFIFFPSSFRKRYGVILVDEEDLVTDKQHLKDIADAHFMCDYRFGWYYQQFLKMEFARSSYAKKYYLIWDSDTIPLNPIRFFDIDNQKMLFTSKTECHSAYFETMQLLIGLNKEVDSPFIAEHMVVDVEIMQRLISQIELSSCQGDSCYEKIIYTARVDEPNAFSEFETYGTFCHHYYPERFLFRELRTFRYGGSKYSRFVSGKQLGKLAKSYDTASFESWDSPSKSWRKFQNRCESFLLKSIIALSRIYK